MWGGAHASAFLTNSQVVQLLVVVVWGPQARSVVPGMRVRSANPNKPIFNMFIYIFLERESILRIRFSKRSSPSLAKVNIVRTMSSSEFPRRT